MAWFIAQSWIIILLSVLLGVFLGWLWWGRLWQAVRFSESEAIKSQARQHEAVVAGKDTEIRRLRAMLDAGTPDMEAILRRSGVGSDITKAQAARSEPQQAPEPPPTPRPTEISDSDIALVPVHPVVESTGEPGQGFEEPPVEDPRPSPETLPPTGPGERDDPPERTVHERGDQDTAPPTGALAHDRPATPPSPSRPEAPPTGSATGPEGATADDEPEEAAFEHPRKEDGSDPARRSCGPDRGTDPARPPEGPPRDAGPRTSGTGEVREEGPVPDGPGTAPTVPLETPAAPQEEKEDGKDDLERIDGIGPRIRTALDAAGIRTFRQLARADEERLRSALQDQRLTFAPSLPTWSRQAAYLAEGDEAGHGAFTSRLVAGREIVATPEASAVAASAPSGPAGDRPPATDRQAQDPVAGRGEDRDDGDDLERIEGIGPRVVGALRTAGINRYAELADSDIARLQAALEASNLRFAPSLPTWSRQARLLADGDEEGFRALARRLVIGPETPGND